MLDLKFIRTFPDKVKEAVRLRKVQGVDVDEVLELDLIRLDVLKHLEDHRALRNVLSENVSKEKDQNERKKAIEEASKVKSEIKKFENDLKIAEGKLTELLLKLPNVLAPDVPMGEGDPDHLELAVWIPEEGYLSKDKLDKGDNAKKYMPEPSFKGRDHLELGKMHDIIDVEQSALTSGSRFCYLKNDAVLLQDALALHLKKKLHAEGFVPMIVPLLVRERVLIGTSHFPEGKDQVYRINSEYVEENQELFLVGSSEPSLFAYHMDKIIPKEKLPYKMYALTSCFRSEVGSWGKDVRGVKRVHQFDKLEIDVVCEPEKSNEIMEYLRGINEWFYQSLKLPYRVIYKCVGDCGYNASHKQYDVEVWLPHQREFIEVASDTNTTDFQARRLNIRYKDGGETRFVHTVNDTGCPMGRVLIAILDNYQKEDGTIEVPEVLREYLGKKEIAL